MKPCIDKLQTKHVLVGSKHRMTPPTYFQGVMSHDPLTLMIYAPDIVYIHYRPRLGLDNVQVAFKI